MGEARVGGAGGGHLTELTRRRSPAQHRLALSRLRHPPSAPQSMCASCASPRGGLHRPLRMSAPHQWIARYGPNSTMNPVHPALNTDPPPKLAVPFNPPATITLVPLVATLVPVDAAKAFDQIGDPPAVSLATYVADASISELPPNVTPSASCPARRMVPFGSTPTLA